MGIKQKTCDKHQVNTIDHPDKFHLQKYKHGFRYLCRQCRYERRRKLYLKNKDHELKLMRIWREKNKDKYTGYFKKYYENNKERLSEYSKNYRAENKDFYIEYQKNWRKNNPEKKNANQREYRKKRRNRDIEFRVLENLRNRLWSALKGNIKESTTMQLTGCSLTELKNYLEKKFEDGMSWDNYGVWHIDHIIPCARFNLSDPEQQKICFHYTNLQPLWGEHNLKKGARLC